ncbi:MAG: ATP-binding cassette domain-containing protein [Actinomyces sp.]|nr:ATP-binding cassette domain-containing protein [Actinomyces sp.]
MTLALSHITRTFGQRTALDDVSFDIPAGRLTGFVGGNGAGKTTTMRIILGVLAPDSGTVTWEGQPIDQARRHGFGYMPEERGLYPKMPLREQLVYFARLHGLPKESAGERADELIEALGLTERVKDPIEKLSLGNQQRAQVAVSLVHDPIALVLDEPFSGLDPMAVDTIVSVLSERAARGIPVLLSSHQLDVVERLCDDLVIIAGGSVRAAGTIADLRAQHSSSRFRLSAGQDLGWLREVPGIVVTELSGNDAVFEPASPNTADAAEVAQVVLRTAIDRGTVQAFTPEAPRLTEIFRDVIADEETGQDQGGDSRAPGDPAARTRRSHTQEDAA